MTWVIAGMTVSLDGSFADADGSGRRLFDGRFDDCFGDTAAGAVRLQKTGVEEPGARTSLDLRVPR
jgi:hypothetical protein